MEVPSDVIAGLEIPRRDIFRRLSGEIIERIGEIFRQRCSCTGWLEVMDIQGIQKTWHPPNNITYLAAYMMTFYPFATKHIIYIYKVPPKKDAER
jgi:hypothetical protein